MLPVGDSVSHIDRTVTNDVVIPCLTSAIFDRSPHSSLALGILARDGVPVSGLEAEYQAHFEFRRRVYVDQTGQLSEDDIGPDGTDRDRDDGRSITFAVFENHADGVRIIGISRLIVRSRGGEANEADGAPAGTAGTPLPVESFYPAAFEGAELDGRSVEVSRVIARHERARVQDIVQWDLFALMLAYATNHNLGRVFAIVEPPLERHLSGVMSIRRIAEPEFVDHYLDYNVPIEIDVAASSSAVTARTRNLVTELCEAEPGLHFSGRRIGAPVSSTGV